MNLAVLACNVGRHRSVTAEWVARQAFAKRLYGGRGVADCPLLSINLQSLSQWTYLCSPDCDECSVLAALGPYDEIPAAYKEVYVDINKYRNMAYQKLSLIVHSGVDLRARHHEELQTRLGSGRLLRH